MPSLNVKMLATIHMCWQPSSGKPPTFWYDLPGNICLVKMYEHDIWVKRIALPVWFSNDVAGGLTFGLQASLLCVSVFWAGSGAESSTSSESDNSDWLYEPTAGDKSWSVCDLICGDNSPISISLQDISWAVFGCLHGVSGLSFGTCVGETLSISSRFVFDREMTDILLASSFILDLLSWSLWCIDAVDNDALSFDDRSCLLSKCNPLIDPFHLPRVFVVWGESGTSMSTPVFLGVVTVRSEALRRLGWEDDSPLQKFDKESFSLAERGVLQYEVITGLK